MGFKKFFILLILILLPNFLLANCYDNFEFEWQLGNYNNAIFTFSNSSESLPIRIVNVDILNKEKKILQTFKPFVIISPNSVKTYSKTLTFNSNNINELILTASTSCEFYVASNPETNNVINPGNSNPDVPSNKNNDIPGGLILLLVFLIIIILLIILIYTLSKKNIPSVNTYNNKTSKKIESKTDQQINKKVSKLENKNIQDKVEEESKLSKDTTIVNQEIKEDFNLNFPSNDKIVKVNEMSDEQIYEIIAEEFDSNRRKGLWLKCEIECDMDEIKAKKLYVQTRFQEIKSLEQIEVDDNNSIKQEEEEVNPTLKALIDLRFKEELTEDSYNKLDKNFKKELLKYIFSVVEQYLNIQKSAVQKVGQKIQKDDTERNFLIYILFEYGCIDGMCLILNISPEVGQKIAIEVYNLQNQTFPEKKFDAAKRKDAIGELLTNKDTLEIAREIHQKGIKSVSRFLIDQDDKASLDIINFLNDEDIQFNFSNSDTAENNIQELLNKLAEFYNHYKTDLLGNPTRLKKYGKEQFENIVQYKRYFEEAANHYNEDGDIFMAITKAKTSLILFSLCQAETIEEVDKDLEELLSSGKLINLSEKLMSSARFILGIDINNR